MRLNYVKKNKLIFERKDEHFHVGICVMHQSLSELEQRIDLLHPDERTYLQGLIYDRRRLSYLLGRISGKWAISHAISIKSLSSFSINTGVFQFPVVKNLSCPNIQVSISHCEEHGVALAFPEEHPLGIDIEKVDDEKIKTIRDLFTYDEHSLFGESDLSEGERCTLLWTIKESLSKVLRTGLTLDFKILEIDKIDKNEHAYCGKFKNFIQYKSYAFIINNFCYSVVMPGKSETDILKLKNILMPLAS